MIPYAFKKVLMEFLFIKDPNKKYYFDLDLDENSKHFESKKCELIFCKKKWHSTGTFYYHEGILSRSG